MLLILKGSCAKSTSIGNIGACIASIIKPHKKVLLVDMDPQADLSKMFGKEQEPKNLYGALLGKYDIEPIKIYDNLDLLPSHEDLYSFAFETTSIKNNHLLLKKLLTPIKDKYDFIFIDCHADMSLLNMNAFAVANRLFIPVKADFLSSSNVPKTIKAMIKSKENFNPSIELGGIFMTFFDERILLHKQAQQTLQKAFEDKLLKSTVRNTVRLAEAPATKCDIFKYDKSSSGANDYLKLTRELLGIST